MVHWGFTLAVLLSTFSTSTALTATVEQMKPQGIRFVIPGTCNYEQNNNHFVSPVDPVTVGDCDTVIAATKLLLDDCDVLSVIKQVLGVWFKYFHICFE